MLENYYFSPFCFILCQLRPLSAPEEQIKMLYEAELNDGLVPRAGEQLASEAPPWQARTSEELDAERKCHYIDQLLLFCFVFC